MQTYLKGGTNRGTRFLLGLWKEDREKGVKKRLFYADSGKKKVKKAHRTSKPEDHSYEERLAVQRSERVVS